MRIRISVESLARKIDGEEKPVRLIQNIHANFFFDDFPLVLEILRREIKSLHPVGLDPENRVER